MYALSCRVTEKVTESDGRKVTSVTFSVTDYLLSISVIRKGDGSDASFCNFIELFSENLFCTKLFFNHHLSLPVLFLYE